MAALELLTRTLASELKSGLLTGMTALEATGADKRQIGEMHKEFLTYLVIACVGFIEWLKTYRRQTAG